VRGQEAARDAGGEENVVAACILFVFVVGDWVAAHSSCHISLLIYISLLCVAA